MLIIVEAIRSESPFHCHILQCVVLVIKQSVKSVNPLYLLSGSLSLAGTSMPHLTPLARFI